MLLKNKLVRLSQEIIFSQLYYLRNEKHSSLIYSGII
jgi:hypothetical protein